MLKRIGIVSAVGVCLTLVLGLIGQAALAALAFVAWVGAVALIAMRNTAQQRRSDPREDMDAESRSLFSPVRKAIDEIEDIVHRNSDSEVMKIVGGEAVTEAKRIGDQVAKALGVRDDLRRAARGRNLAAQQIEKLKADSALAEGETKASLLSALEARQMEVSHYAEVDQAISQIDSGIAQAKAALSEMKARLSLKATSEKAALANQDDDLRETIGRMKSLSLSYDEAEELLKA